MTITGRVENGVIVFPQGLDLQEGDKVTIITAPQSKRSHSILDIPTVSIGAILQPLTRTDDLLEEMLDSRP